MKSRSSQIYSLVLLLGISFSLLTCEKNENKGCGKTNISQSNESESHNNGQNCMSCHNENGDREGCFNMAGSAWYQNGNAVSSGQVRIYSEPNGQGTLLATLSIDQLGNFFTTEAFSVGSGFYPVVDDGNGKVLAMPSIATSGTCNSCHGVSTKRIELP